MKQLNQDINHYHPGYEEFRHVLAELKNNINIIKAFVTIVPYPITMWNPEGHLVFANEEAISFYGNTFISEKDVLWKNHILNNLGLPHPANIIKNGSIITIPALSDTNEKKNTRLPVHFREIEAFEKSLLDIPDKILLKKGFLKIN